MLHCNMQKMARICQYWLKTYARARDAFSRLTGQAGVEEVLDALFGRFCLGK